MTIENQTKAEQDLLDILRSVNALESMCKHLRAPIAIPTSAYKYLAEFRNDIARWGIENIARAGGEKEEL
jgi:hypothetical protein